MIDEGRLIEIAQRFRKLEDAHEALDLHLAAKSESLKDRMNDLEFKHAERKITYDKWCRCAAPIERERNELQEQRETAERALESCRDDMNFMQDELRRLSALLLLCPEY